MMTAKKRLIKKTLNKDLLNEIENKNQEEDQLLNPDDAVNYYEKKLHEDKEAVNYLHKKGITDAEIIKRLKIGYNDNSIIDKLSKDQTDFLIDKGIIRREGEQVNCLTFPFYDDKGSLTGIYGLDINNEKEIYTDDISKSFFNIQALKVYDEVILTNSIIDGLSLMQLGFNNAVSVMNTDCLSSDHIKLLLYYRIKTVVIAFDNEVKSISAGELFKGLLLTEGIKVKIINPIETNNWNEYLLTSGDGDFLKNLIDCTEILTPTEVKERLIVKKEGFKYLFAIGDITYRLTGLKDIFVNNLRVNIRAEYEGEKFPDNVDLYSARSRSSFSSMVSGMFNMEPKRVEKDLLRILDYLEAERDRLLNTDGTEKIEVLTDEEKRIGLDFLKSPDLFKQIVDDMTSLGYVGEDLNKQLLYLCATSRLMDDPISVMIVSQSASGKSMLVDTVKKLIPADEAVSVTSLSDQALNYIESLMHKFLVFGEAVHNEIIEHQIREMLSSKELTRLVTVKDDKTGKMISKLIKKKVIVSSVMSTTNHKINPENASRYFLINADESKEQTKRIHEAQKLKYTLKKIKEKKDLVPQIINKHIYAQKLLRKLYIVNPFSKYLDFPDSTMRTRRDNERFLDLIASVCFLRQYQKEVKINDDIEYIECDLEDYRCAYEIMVNGVLSSTMTELPNGAIFLYEEIRNMVRETAKEKNLKPEEVSFIQREVREYTKLGAEFIKKHIRSLVEYEYINISSGRNKGTRFCYQLRNNEPIDKMSLDIIPDADKIKKIIAGEN